MPGSHKFAYAQQVNIYLQYHGDLQIQQRGDIGQRFVNSIYRLIQVAGTSIASDTGDLVIQVGSHVVRLSSNRTGEPLPDRAVPAPGQNRSARTQGPGNNGRSARALAGDMIDDP